MKRPQPIHDRVSSRWVCLTLLVALGLSLGTARAQFDTLGGTSGPSLKDEQLVPAALGVRTDKPGNSWNLEQNGTLGRVGNSMVNSGLTLLVNNQQFYTYQPMMTADGLEFVLRNRQNSTTAGLQIVRRIRLYEREGIVRYLELLSNTTPNVMTLNVSLRTNFSGNYKTFLSDEGNSSVVLLGARETGILVTPGSSQSNRAFVFSLCSENSPLKPTISSQNKYGLTFQYNVTIPAGPTIAIAHAVSQIPVPRDFDRKTLQRVFRPVALERLQSEFPREIRQLAANIGAIASPGGVGAFASSDVSSLGVDRGRRDVLALGDQTRLLGTASSETLSLKTAFGETEISLDAVQAIVGNNRGRRDRARVFLRDGQVLTGDLEVDGLEFVMASGGTMNLDINSLDRLVRAQSDEDGVWSDRVDALVETWNGDRIALEAGAAIPLVGVSPWGRLEFTLGDLTWLAPIEDEPVGHYAELKDGTRCFVFLTGDLVSVTSKTFGTFEIEVPQIRAIVTAEGLRRSSETGETRAEIGNQTQVLAAGGQRLVGPVSNPTLSMLTNAETIQIRPEEIRELSNLTAAEGDRPGIDGPRFRIELWGGGIMIGHLAENFLRLQVNGQSWQMPLSDVRFLKTAVPALPAASREEIGRLIRQLGAEDWQTREKATEELGSYGFLARALLEEENRTSRDPEVRRRLERVLAELQ